MPRGRRPTSQITVRTTLTVLATLAAVLLVGYALVEARLALLYIGLSAFLAVAIDRPVGWLKRWMPRWAAVLLMVLGLMGAVVGAMAILVPTVIQQATGLWGHVSSGLPEMLNRPPFQSLDQRLHVREQLQTWVQSLPTHLESLTGPVIAAVGKVFSGALAALSILFLTMFMLLYGPDLVDHALRELPQGIRARVKRLSHQMHESIGGYLTGMGALCSINATCAAIALAIIGVPYFLPLALISGSSSLVPYAGPLVVGAGVTLITLASSSVLKAVLVAVYLTAYGQMEGNVIGPMVFRRTVHINPLVSLVSLLFFGEMAGLAGAIVAVPLAAIGQLMVMEWLGSAAHQASKQAPDPEDTASPTRTRPEEATHHPGTEPH